MTADAVMGERAGAEYSPVAIAQALKILADAVRDQEADGAGYTLDDSAEPDSPDAVMREEGDGAGYTLDDAFEPDGDSSMEPESPDAAAVISTGNHWDHQ